MTRLACGAFALAAVAACAAPPTAHKEIIHPGAAQVSSSFGPTHNRVPLYVVSEGFTQADLDSRLYERAAKAVTDSLFKSEPYAAYKSLFTVVRWDVPSAVRGVTHKKSGPVLDTPFKTKFMAVKNGSGVMEDSRMIQFQGDSPKNAKIPYGKIAEVTGNGTFGTTIILMNDTTWGGTAYLGSHVLQMSCYDPSKKLDAAVPLQEAPAEFAPVLPHEFAHAFAALGDEYSNVDEFRDDVKSWPDARLPRNLSKTNDPAKVKWKEWIVSGDLTAPDASRGAGGGYYDGRVGKRSLFKPTGRCRMDHVGDPFCVVCKQTIGRTIFDGYVKLVEGYLPAPGTYKVAANAKFGIEIWTAPLPASQFKVEWILDGRAPVSFPPVPGGPQNHYVCEVTTANAPGVMTLTMLVTYHDNFLGPRRSTGAAKNTTVLSRTWTLKVPTPVPTALRPAGGYRTGS